MSRVNGPEGTPSFLSLKPMNIASVRAASLHASGLRAAARLTSSTLMREDIGAPKEGPVKNTEEMLVTVSKQSCLSSLECISSSTNLSYTNSQEPGEDSQLNAFLMVDKLVSMNAGFILESSEPQKSSVPSSLKGSHGFNALHSLARSAEMKNVQDKLGVYDLVDSQPNTDAELLSPLQPKQAPSTKVMNRRKGQQKFGVAMRKEGGPIEKLDPSVRQSTLEKTASNSVVAPRILTAWSKSQEDNGNQAQYSHDRDFSKTQEIKNCVTHEADGKDTENDVEETMIMQSPDIGAATQVALEAIDIMRCGIELNEQGSPHNEGETPALCNIGNDTQMAIDAIDIMRNGFDVETGFTEETKVKKEGWKRSRDEGHNEQQAMDPIINGNKKWASLPVNGWPVGKGGAFRRTSRTPRRQNPDCSKQADAIAAGRNKRFLLDFSSEIVPRRKRSRLGAPSGSLHEYGIATPRQDHNSDPPKPDSFAENKALKDESPCVDSRRPAPWKKDDVADTRPGVLTESTKGEDLRPIKAMEWYTWFEPPRKSRKRESSSIRVFFSNGLPDATIKHQKKLLAKLGGHLATSVADSTHFVVDSFVRTRNMLESMAAGKEIITTSWLEDCSQAEYFVNEKSYILEDAKKERELGFSMHSSLAAARRKPLLEGLKFVVSSNTFPDFEALKAIIEGAGGQAVLKVPCDPSDAAKDVIVIASEKDFEFCAEFLAKGCKVYSTEFILQGVVMQSLDFSRNHLFEEHPH